MIEPLRIELVRGLHNLRPRHRGCALTVGKFDGIHLGHQVLLERTRDEARRAGVPAAVLSFDPSPRDFFHKDRAPPRISSLRDKLAALQHYGIDRLVLVRFDQCIANIPPKAFLEEVLLAKLGASALIVGDDLRFGRNRSGDIQYLRSRADELGYRVLAVDTIEVGGERCSSSAVREALSNTDFPRVERLLGRPYRVTGRIRKGLQLGRQLDMPTANISVRKRLAIPYGVYAVVAREGDRTWKGVASLGIRPTLNLSQCLLETHLFDTQVDLYGRVLEVEFRHFLRPELKFDSIDLLKKQMHEDATAARRLLDS
ncbi:FMN adenylyltransferase /riboflavin kinase [Panacagrimonas perspica]|uniref:Riboflavin biosynthesis protein n=1 Tax=Panacagrimonas perspica TaxID=381431 RepID=A0A4R7PB74_9GAMM|nr:bifunctional riboflavin kinase/FAD synthetase [Panacagrimonas perspica]TDU31237.1 FMN adenylyltransferase /riboflavin kinase [Panacagrimonas perspica]